ncbi:hypothetical protein [Paraliomyxa miuraensis]|uniref:hypothetical protein n=1 Tax=Paraliomyxa miuraensis TaxID=376150 RepID=UPI00225A8A50|nr:hypothetical protein [Paraliomyxa miuraensis]MCX4246794.1 hypothetical protein [Paraliomyxa miuraensis]
MRLAPTHGFSELVFHVLAHVPLGGAGCSYDPRYRAWARAHMPEEPAQWLEQDAAVLERAWGQGRAPAAVHAWPELLESVAELQAIATVELGALPISRVRAPWVLQRLQAVGGPELELLHATLCAQAPWHASWYGRVLSVALARAADRVRPWIERAALVLPSLASTRIELAWALGSRGRSFPARIVVGAPAEWNEMEPGMSAVLALHEQAVRDGGHASYARAEWAALTRLAVRMDGARTEQVELARLHARWLASLELRPLLAELRAMGVIGHEHELALHEERERRAALLAHLHREPCGLGR